MAMDEMTADEFKQNLDSLLNEDWFPTIGITRDGERRMVVVPVAVFRAMRRTSVREPTEEEVKSILEAKMPDGFEHLDEELKADKG
jgi:hypothetical protein